jgi:hypothetical protein
MKRRIEEEATRSVRPRPACRKRAVVEMPDGSSKRHCPWVQRETAVAQREAAVAQHEAAVAQHEATLVEVARRLAAWQAQLRQRECDGPCGLPQSLPYCS